MKTTLEMCSVLALHKLVIPLALLVAILAPAGPVHAQDPDFSTIDDPLDGDYELFTVDDLLIFRTTPQAGNTQSQVNNYLLDTDNQDISSQTKRTAVTAPCYLASGRQPQVSRAGRFFALGHDVVVTFSPSVNAGGSDCASTNGDSNMGLYAIDPQTSDPPVWTHKFTSATNTALAMEDFNLDGLDDLLVFSDSEAFVATANVVTDTTQGLAIGPALTFASADLAPRTDPASGDFNDDGLVDVAWAAFDGTVHFATVCPGDVAGTVCAGASPWELMLDPLQSRSTVIDVPVSQTGCAPTSASSEWGIAMAAGNFAEDGSDGLVTVNLGEPEGYGFCSPSLYWWEFDGNLKATLRTQENALLEDYDTDGIHWLDVYATAAKLYWLGDNEQVVLGIGGQSTSSSGSCANQFQRFEATVVISFKPFEQWSPEISYDSDCVGSSGHPQQYPWVNGMAVGRFAAIPDDPDTQTDFNLQFATLTNDGKVRIYDTDAPSNYKPKLVSTTTLESGLGLQERSTPGGTNQINWLLSGDLQGRSMLLGAPTVVRVNKHSQPSVILGAPPMHVDYILPDPSTVTETQVINFSAAPDNFNSQYSVSDTSDKQSSNTNTSSYSYAYSETTEEKVKLEVPLISSISGDFKQAWQQKAESTTSNYAFTQNEFAFNAATTTGFSDEVWYSSNDFNTYFYPVIGQTVVVTDSEGMTSTQPLFVTFSGPSDSTGVIPVSGATVEWYQPVHEPGQIFSYPWNLAQLQARFPGLNLLTPASPEPFFTDDSGTSETLTWSQNNGASQTTGTSHTHSFETDNSVSAGSIPKEGGGLEVTGSIDYNNSTAMSSLNQSSTTVGESQGIGINKPKFPTAYQALYQYLVRPFIFGNTPAVPTVQTLNLSTDIKTTGPLRTAYAADPTDPQSGSWWTSDASPYTQQIDVALNHPQRWNFDSSGSGLACVAGDCAIPSVPLASDLWNNTFYHMRGLFVTIGGKDGPQRTQATVGDDVFLQARVYNYSLKDMPAGSEIHARFYRQEIDGTTPTGDSVLIDEVTAPPLPGFNSDAHPDVPNWTTVSTSFAATGDMAAKDYIFWVLVWVEQNGAMLPEIAGHGLTALPGALATIGDAPIEMVTITTADGAHQSTSFSNNVGMFKQKIYIAADSTDLTGTQEGALSLAGVGVAEAPQLGKGMYLLTGNALAATNPTSGVEVLAIDGALEDVDARILDIDMLPHIAGGNSDSFSMPIRAGACGTHELLVVARTGAANHAEEIVSYDVPCGPIYMPALRQGAP